MKDIQLIADLSRPYVDAMGNSLQDSRLDKVHHCFARQTGPDGVARTNDPAIFLQQTINYFDHPP